MLILIGLLTALSMLVLVWKVGIRKILGYEVLVDCAVSFFLIALMSSTYSGAVTALVAGLVFSVAIRLLKMTMYREVIVIKKNDDGLPTLEWEKRSPKQK